ncbi:MAG: hypothetical protein KF734_22570 [Saprospiraceae bacterium]|nr:hypothetical protein [Saprospiraceae bacterium]
MNQLFTHLALLGGGALILFCCTPKKDCRDLTGRWATREGRVLLFQPDGRALWLFKFGSEFDTFPARYQYDCRQKPATLDLSGFQTGPLTGKTLYGIIEWASDTAFRFDAESGTSPEVRPKTFSVEQTQQYFRENYTSIR